MDARRSFILMTVGAVVGLGIAGAAVIRSKTAGTTVPAEDVALINGRPILASDFSAQVESEFGSPFVLTYRAQRHKVLDDMIREEIFVQRGLELGLASRDPNIRAALVSASEQQLAANITAEQPSETALRDFFNRHRAAYASEGLMSLHDLVVKGVGGATADETASAAAKALRAKAPLAAVVRLYGLEESGRVSDGEEFYFAAKIHLGDKLFDTAKSLPSGAVSDPQIAADGIHILSMVRNTPPVMRSYAQARENVYSDFKAAEQAKLEAANIHYLRSKAEIHVAEGYR